MLRAVLLAAVWFASALAAAVPGLLLLGNADGRHPQVAGMALVLASVLAVGVGVACAIGRSGLSLRTSAVVVLLCLVAEMSIGLDEEVYGSWLVFGGAAGLLAGLAGALSFAAGRQLRAG